MSENIDTDGGESQSQSGGLGFDDIVIERDETGARKAKPVYVDELEDTVKAIPLNNSGKDEYVKPLAETASVSQAIAEGDIDPDELSDEEREELEEVGLSQDKLAEMFETHITDPPLVEFYNRALPEGEEREHLDAEFIDEHLYPGAEDGLFFAILLATGMDDLVDVLRSTPGGDESDDESEGDSGNT